MSEPYITTAEGLEKLKNRLRAIRETDRPQNVRDIEEARAHGDLRENAEYHAAKERQGLLDAEMRILEDKIARSNVVDLTGLKGDKIVFGARVTLLNIETDEEVVYTITGEDEADAKNGFISYKAPIAKALLGKKLGDEIVVKAPGGDRSYEVTGVHYG
ncbi:MAG: transcription elongation factor GreA [Deltaproteobacteria bacterium]|nr:transcription elongation factor GreA [Deltaproteobacteria bacterium]